MGVNMGHAARPLFFLLALSLIIMSCVVPSAAGRTIKSISMAPKAFASAGKAFCAKAQGNPTMYYSFEVADLDVDVQNGVVTVTPYSSMGDYTAKIGYASGSFNDRYLTDVYVYCKPL